ncbi:DUF4126 domain-containing protein [Trichloromonas sp.]|uniref:DUF4126 domain-containing protein n=1 Tax=Trichloromonas sp. TaxID=3069249 RepID=UPI002A3FB75B|nr:DUF4126 domain-containing protein [Trichloromonas sp.]
MEHLDQLIQTIALSMGAAWASGINLYAAILTLGVLGATGNMTLPPGLEVLSDPMVIFAAGVMYFIEFFADKTPGVDTGWDTIHTFIRIPAGAVLAAGAIGDVSPALSIAVGLVGGGLAAGTHLTKAGSRVVINTSPEPFSNWFASVGEDVLVIGGLWTALHSPWLFVGALILFILLMIWLLPKIWRGVKGVLNAVARLFRKERMELPPPESGGDGG